MPLGSLSLISTLSKWLAEAVGTVARLEMLCYKSIIIISGSGDGGGSAVTATAGVMRRNTLEDRSLPDLQMKPSNHKAAKNGGLIRARRHRQPR